LGKQADHQKKKALGLLRPFAPMRGLHLNVFFVVRANPTSTEPRFQNPIKPLPFRR
jgi:hypothetical protein